MKYLKKYKLFESTKSIDEICEEYGIQNYIINPDGTVDVDGSVSLSNKGLDKIPVKFGKVTDTFWCDNNQLTTLEGCPKTVDRDFQCYNNKLTSLEGCPKTIGGDFFCFNNKLTSLEGCPKTIGRGFYCYDNKLTTLEGCPKTVGGDFYCDNNQLTTLTGLTDVSIGRYFSHSNNPIYYVTSSWLTNGMVPDMDLIELFNDVQVIKGNKLYLSKLEYFHDEIGKPLPDMEEVKKYYEIIE